MSEKPSKRIVLSDDELVARIEHSAYHHDSSATLVLLLSEAFRRWQSEVAKCRNTATISED